MDIRGIAAVLLVAFVSFSAAAEADLGLPGERLVGVGALVSYPQCRLGGEGNAAAPPAADVVDAEPARLSPVSQRAIYEPLVEQTARAYGLDSALLHAVIHAESSYDAKAVSKQGAQGLMQLMPETARRYDVADAFDPAQNVRGGARYLRDLLEIFHDDLRLVLAAYNAGEYAVIRNGYRVPPLKATAAYVTRVLQLYRHNSRMENGNR